MTAESVPAAAEEVAALLATGDVWRAIARAREMLRDGASMRQISRLSRLASRAAAGPPLQPWKVALLSSFSIELIHDALIAQGFLNGLAISIYQAGFDQYRQEILDPQSGLYRFQPDAVVLAVEGRDWLPTIYHRYLAALGGDITKQIDDAARDVAALVAAFRRQCHAALLLHNAAVPPVATLGALDGRVGPRQSFAVARFNESLDDLARRAAGICIVDYAGLVSRHGARNWYDARMDHYAKAPIAGTRLFSLAAEYMRFFRSLTGRSKKCLVLDLDNTLWGGVLGEEGVDGIALGPTYPGSAFVQFQRDILALRDRGVILAVASKNNRADVEQVFRDHPHMALRLDDFSSIEINWEAKSRSIARIARQLGIGLEHMVFADDSPAECAEVSEALPQVTVLVLPRQPELQGQALDEEGLFDTLTLSEEDRQRGALYRQRALATELQGQATSLEDFYRRLQMEVTIDLVTPATLPRAAQLTQKTNQFNVTTIRYSEPQLKSQLHDPASVAATVRVKDRFGDHGIVGLMLAIVRDDALEIDTFLLSCRVIGRTIETAMLAWLSRESRHKACRTLRGRIIPTPKNAPARDLFSRHGFQRASGDDTTESIWMLDLEINGVDCPVWLQVTDLAQGCPDEPPPAKPPRSTS